MAPIRKYLIVVIQNLSLSTLNYRAFEDFNNYVPESLESFRKNKGKIGQLIRINKKTIHFHKKCHCFDPFVLISLTACLPRYSCLCQPSGSSRHHGALPAQPHQNIQVLSARSFVTILALIVHFLRGVRDGPPLFSH